MKAKEKQLWLRLGVTIHPSDEEKEKILQGDKETLKKVIKKGKFKIDGESYIPLEEEDIIFDF